MSIIGRARQKTIEADLHQIGVSGPKSRVGRIGTTALKRTKWSVFATDGTLSAGFRCRSLRRFSSGTRGFGITTDYFDPSPIDAACWHSGLKSHGGYAILTVTRPCDAEDAGTRTRLRQRHSSSTLESMRSVRSSVRPLPPGSRPYCSLCFRSAHQTGGAIEMGCGTWPSRDVLPCGNRLCQAGRTAISLLERLPLG